MRADYSEEIAEALLQSEEHEDTDREISNSESESQVGAAPAPVAAPAGQNIQPAHVAPAGAIPPPIQPAEPEPAYLAGLPINIQAAYRALGAGNNIGQVFSVLRMWGLFNGDDEGAEHFEALMLAGIGVSELKRAICEGNVPADILVQLLTLAYEPRVEVKKGSLSTLTAKFDSTEQFWQRCRNSLLLPEKKNFSETFLKQCLGNQKILLSGNIRRVQLPNIPELDTEVLGYWTLYPRVTICLPDPITRKANVGDRNYLASVINTVYPGAMDALLNEIVRLRLPAPDPLSQNGALPASIAGAMQNLVDLPAGVKSRLSKRGLSREKQTLPYLATVTTPEGVMFAVSNIKEAFGAVNPALVPQIRAYLAARQLQHPAHH